jgi:hypothetical protein
VSQPTMSLGRSNNQLKSERVTPYQPDHIIGSPNHILCASYVVLRSKGYIANCHKKEQTAAYHSQDSQWYDHDRKLPSHTTVARQNFHHGLQYGKRSSQPPKFLPFRHPSPSRLFGPTHLTWRSRVLSRVTPYPLASSFHFPGSHTVINPVKFFGDRVEYIIFPKL